MNEEEIRDRLTKELSSKFTFSLDEILFHAALYLMVSYITSYICRQSDEYKFHTWAMKGRNFWVLLLPERWQRRLYKRAVRKSKKE